MPGWRKLAEVNFVSLQAAVFCAECELIGANNTPRCLVCGSRALVSLARLLGGSLRGQNTARVMADRELHVLVRELINTVPPPAAARESRILAYSGRHHLPAPSQAEAEGRHSLLDKSDIDLGELDLEPTIRLIAERARTITAATGTAVALRRGNETVCRARAGRTAPDLGVRLQSDAGISAQCLRTGDMLLCEDAEQNPHVDLASCRCLGVRSILVAPLRYFRRTLGLFEILSSVPHAFDQRHAAAVEMLAGITVAAIALRANKLCQQGTSPEPALPFQP